jgi:hypothetical protein
MPGYYSLPVAERKYKCGYDRCDACTTADAIPAAPAGHLNPLDPSEIAS